jgi:RNA polymerase sigma-70 factor (ECF subfamily)
MTAAPDNGRKAGGQDALDNLAVRLKDGDPEVLRDVMRLLGDLTERRIRGRLGNALTDADYKDVMSKALVRLWYQRHRFDPARANVAQWFYVLSRNIALDALRSRSRSHEVAVEDLDLLPAPEHEATAGEPSQEKRDLLQALEHISPVNRRILLSGLTETELSLELGLKPGTIRVRRLRSLKHIRTALRGMGYDV